MELLVTITIIGILAALAGPSFSDLIASQRAKAAASDLFGSLLKARSEAITRNANVTLSQKSGGWQNGWQVLDPSGAAAALEDRGTASGVTITTNPVNKASMVYRPSGRVQGAVLQFIISTTVGSTTNYQCVSVDLTGRPYVKNNSAAC